MPTLSGRKTLRVAPGTKHGTVQRLRGEGPPRLGGKPAGDIHYRFLIDMPTELDRRAVRAGRQALGDDERHRPARSAVRRRGLRGEVVMATRRRTTITVDTQRGVFMISVAAELAEMHPQTLRMYEARGLIEPAALTEGHAALLAGGRRAPAPHPGDDDPLGLNLAGVERVLGLERQLEGARERLEQLEARSAQMRAEMEAEMEAVRRSFRAELVPIRHTTAMVRQARPPGRTGQRCGPLAGQVSRYGPLAGQVSKADLMNLHALPPPDHQRPRPWPGPWPTGLRGTADHSLLGRVAPARPGVRAPACGLGRPGEIRLVSRRRWDELGSRLVGRGECRRWSCGGWRTWRSAARASSTWQHRAVTVRRRRRVHARRERRALAALRLRPGGPARRHHDRAAVRQLAGNAGAIALPGGSQHGPVTSLVSNADLSGRG